MSPFRVMVNPFRSYSAIELREQILANSKLLNARNKSLDLKSIDLITSVDTSDNPQLLMASVICTKKGTGSEGVPAIVELEYHLAESNDMKTILADFLAQLSELLCKSSRRNMVLRERYDCHRDKCEDNEGEINDSAEEVDEQEIDDSAEDADDEGTQDDDLEQGTDDEASEATTIVGSEHIKSEPDTESLPPYEQPPRETPEADKSDSPKEPRTQITDDEHTEIASEEAYPSIEEAPPKPTYEYRDSSISPWNSDDYWARQEHKDRCIWLKEKEEERERKERKKKNLATPSPRTSAADSDTSDIYLAMSRKRAPEGHCDYSSDEAPNHVHPTDSQTRVQRPHCDYSSDEALNGIRLAKSRKRALEDRGDCADATESDKLRAQTHPPMKRRKVLRNRASAP